MMLEFDYPSQAAIDLTMASPERTEARAKTRELLSMFDGRLYHVVFERRMTEPVSRTATRPARGATYASGRIAIRPLRPSSIGSASILVL
ncbi:MAG: hypothetical protein R3D62_10505 [Xanthobacteraceae bacterium]